MRLWREAWTPATWREYLGVAGTAMDDDAIRRNTHTGRPLGAEDFVGALERNLQRRLALERGGRRTKSLAAVGQLGFGFQEAPCTVTAPSSPKGARTSGRDSELLRSWNLG
jgi:hypothetical protein